MRNWPRTGFAFALLIILFAKSAAAQRADTTLRNLHWSSIAASFTEPSRAEFIKSVKDESLYLQFGYGGEVYASGNHSLGIEGMEWSRLRALNDFRFPVETADYLFGIYDILRVNGGLYRVRLSHISSHLVDGVNDTVIGGSSSRYSKEFATFERQDSIYGHIVVSYGVRYIFHQVQRFENSVQLLGAAEAAFPLDAAKQWQSYFSLAAGALTMPAKDIAAQIGLHHYAGNSISSVYFGVGYGDARRGVYGLIEGFRTELGLRISPR